MELGVGGMPRETKQMWVTGLWAQGLAGPCANQPTQPLLPA